MNFLIRLAIILLLFMLSGCTGLDFLEPTPDQSRFFYMEEVDAAFTGSENTAILIGPHTISKHLDRSTIAYFPAPNTVAYSENARWAAPLADNIARLLASSLSAELNTSLVGTTREMPSLDWDYRVGFRVNKLGGQQGKTVELQVSWWLIRKDSEEEHFDGARYSAAYGNEADLGAYVDAMRTVILEWTNDVSDAIKARTKKSPGPE